MSLITRPTFNLQFPSYLRKGLVLEFLMNEGEGTVVYDTSGNGNHGEINGAKWVKLPNGKWVLEFDGVDDYVRVPYSDNLNIVGAITMVALVKPEKGTGQQAIIAPAGIHRMYSLYLRHEAGVDVGARMNINGTEYYVMTGTVNYGEWNFIAAVFNGQKWVIYINEWKSPPTVATASYSRQNGAIYIGWCGDLFPPKYFNGLIAFVHIYNRALTESKIKTLYEMAKKLVPLG